MEPGAENRISELYHRALQCTPEKLSAFLEEACSGDDTLRQEIESLLRYETASVQFLETPAAIVASQLAGTPDRSQMLGRQLGPYTVAGHLGAGGMGEVYRARDSKLGRDVAIKILPSHLTTDAERRTRFAREARLLATLNHPNVGGIYGFEEFDGVTALVLELVEGPTLADRLSREPLPVPEALAIARQIADALDAAHEKGIVHRDLKPANIVLQGPAITAGVTSSDVRAKVLDFGLAKTITVGFGDELTGPTVAPDTTAEGRILGTPGYMSPEQARGLRVDKRTDIWAFGCVLFEMLTGRRPFEGATPTDTLARILEREPNWSLLNPATPDAVRKLLRRCLEKDLSRRMRDIGDARLELDEAVQPAAAPGASQPSKRPAWLLYSGLILTPVVAGLLVWVGPLRLWQFQPETPLLLTKLTFDEGLQTDPALSPGGESVAYASNKAGNFDIYSQPIGGGNPVRITSHQAHDWQPDWSTTQQIVFRSERDGGGLYVVATTGGTERRVATFGTRPVWSPDGTKILFAGAPINDLYIVGIDGSSPRRIDSCCGAYGWMPDGSAVSVLGTTPDPVAPYFRTVDVASGQVRQWTASANVTTSFRELRVGVLGGPLVWAADGRALYFIGGGGVASVWRLDVDPDRGLLTGGPRRMATMAEQSTSVTIARETGALAFGASTGASRLWWYPLDATGRRLDGSPQALTSAESSSSTADVTPDGAMVAFTTWPRSGLAPSEIRIRSLAEPTDRTIRVSGPGTGARSPVRLSPDGKRIVFMYVAAGSTGGRSMPPRELRLIDLDTNEESPLTTAHPGPLMPGGWSSDGQFVVVAFERRRQQAGAKGMAIGLMPIAAAPEADAHMKIVTTFDGKDGLLEPSISPDGKWVAFAAGKGTFRIAVVGSSDGLWSEPQDEGSWRYPNAPGALYDPRWSADGRLLYFTSMRDGLLNVWAAAFDPASGKFGSPFQVTQFDGQGERMMFSMGMTAVGRGGLAVRTFKPTGGVWLLRQPQ